MSKRKYREASQAKRMSPADIALDKALGDPVEFTQADALQADLAYNASKADPLAFDRKIHTAHQEEIRLARTMLGRAG